MQPYATESLISSASVLTVDGCRVVEFKAHLTQQLSIHNYRHVFTYNFHTFPSIFVPTNRSMYAPGARPVHPSNTNSHSPGPPGWVEPQALARLPFVVFSAQLWVESLPGRKPTFENQTAEWSLIMQRRTVPTMTWYGGFQKWMVYNGKPY